MTIKKDKTSKNLYSWINNYYGIKEVIKKTKSAKEKKND